MVDLLVILLIGLATLWGYLRGILRSVLTVAALTVAYLASAPLASPIGDLMAAHTEWAANVCYAVGRVIGALLIYVSLSISAQVADRRLGRTRFGFMRGWNRTWGAVAGFVTGLLIALILLFAADAMLKAYPEGGGALAESARRSSLVRLVSRFNPADRYLVTDFLKLLRVAREDPQVLEELSHKEGIRRLLEHPTVARLFHDEVLAEAVRDGRFQDVFANENLRRLLEDKELRELLVSPAVRSAIQDVVSEHDPDSERDES